MKVLVALEIRGGVAQPSSLELLTAARGLVGESGTVEGLILAPDAPAVAVGIKGSDVALCASHPRFDHVTAESYGAILGVAVRERAPDVVLCSYTALGLDIAPALSARSNLPLVAYCTALAVDGHAVKATSQIYGGKLLADTHTSLPAIFVVNPGSYVENIASGPKTAEIVTMDLPNDIAEPKVRFVRETTPDESVVDLAKAERIVCVGRGIGDKDSIDLARDVAELLGAEIAGSRPVVDGGWLPKERQVGKSGRKVKPKLYLSVGVSGAPEHVEGMGRSDVIIAVNSDTSAPIFDIAHYAATCDLFDLLPALSEQLRAAGA